MVRVHVFLKFFPPSFEHMIWVCLVMPCLCMSFESDYSCVSSLPEQDKRVTLIQEKQRDERFRLQICSFFPSVTVSFCNTSTSLACVYLFSPTVFRRCFCSSHPLTIMPAVSTDVRYNSDAARRKGERGEKDRR